MNNSMNGVQPAHPATMQMMQATPNGAMRPGPMKATFEDSHSEQHKQLNTAIYDHFLRMGAFDLARKMRDNDKFELILDPSRKMEDEDESQGSRPADLPAPGLKMIKMGAGQSSFLLDWYSMFQDMFKTGTNKNGTNNNSLTAQYLQQNANITRLQQHRTQQMLQSGMMPAGLSPAMAIQMQRNMMLNNNVRQMAPNMMGNPQQRAMSQNVRMMHAQNMARDAQAADGDNRPRTPSSGENAPSPSKRPRLDGNPPFGVQNMGPGVIPQGMNNPQDSRMQAQNLLQANGLNPANLTPAQFNTFQQQTAQRANMGGQGSPNTMTPNLEIQQMAGNGGDFYNGSARMQNGNNGHALQDYQMQLMLLERQNRKRLEMAKAEHENIGGGSQGQNGMIQGFVPPNMSPSGSRQGGPSPTPNEQVKRTPQMAKTPIPGSSPMPDGPMQNRASPSAMNYNQMPPGMDNGMAMAPNGMRPPSSHPPNFNGQINPQNPMIRGQSHPGGPGQNPNFSGQQGPMGPGGQPGSGQAGTPQQRNAMPPPAGVPPNNQNATGRAPSPAPSAAASTPQQANKPNPKKKDTKKGAKASQPTKKGAAGATPAEGNDNAPATSTPATPITSTMNSGSFEKNKTAGGPVPPNGPNANAGSGQPNGVPNATQPQPPTAVAATGPPQPDLNAAGADPNSGFSEFIDSNINMEFGNLEAADVLDNFDFNQFIDGDGNGGADFGTLNFDLGGYPGEEMGGAVDA